MKTREYGNQKTKLHLTERAELAFRQTDPIHIYELESDSGLIVYRISGCVETDLCSEEYVNDVLEALYVENRMANSEVFKRYEEMGELEYCEVVRDYASYIANDPSYETINDADIIDEFITYADTDGDEFIDSMSHEQLVAFALSVAREARSQRERESDEQPLIY